MTDLVERIEAAGIKKISGDLFRIMNPYDREVWDERWRQVHPAWSPVPDMV